MSDTARVNENGDYVMVCDGNREATQQRARDMVDAMMAQMRKYGVYGEASVAVMGQNGVWQYSVQRDTY